MAEKRRIHRQGDQIYVEWDWLEFQKSGLLWLINTILRVFGICIVVHKDDAGNIKVFPAFTNVKASNEKQARKVDLIRKLFLQLFCKGKLEEYLKSNNDSKEQKIKK